MSLSYNELTISLLLFQAYYAVIARRGERNLKDSALSSEQAPQSHFFRISEIAALPLWSLAMTMKMHRAS
jgi:hypothetical protein